MYVREQFINVRELSVHEQFKPPTSLVEIKESEAAWAESLDQDEVKWAVRDVRVPQICASYPARWVPPSRPTCMYICGLCSRVRFKVI